MTGPLQLRQRIIDALRLSPMTSPELARALSQTVDAICKCLVRLERARLVMRGTRRIAKAGNGKQPSVWFRNWEVT